MANRDGTENNFGILRLFFAILVILSHSAELVDGNRSREILTKIFGTMSFGDLGVDGFFLISGYLITKSFEHSSSVLAYIIKRVLRIYPGYIAAFLLCTFALGPFVGGNLSDLSISRVMIDLARLAQPVMPGSFSDTPYPVLNGSMGTIAYEFRCYLLVVVLGVAGLLTRRGTIVAITITFLSTSALHPATIWLPSILNMIVGGSQLTIRLTGIFLCGVLYYLFEDRIRYKWSIAIISALALIFCMFSSYLAESAIAILGGYLIFWFALAVRAKKLASVGRSLDLSYGIYLYAWPIQKLLIWRDPTISPWIVFIEATIFASMMAFASWYLIEKPFMNLKANLISARQAGSTRLFHPFP